MNKFKAIKPGPKPKTDEGKDDKRRRVLPETKDRKSTRLNSSHYSRSRMPSSA